MQDVITIDPPAPIQRQHIFEHYLSLCSQDIAARTNQPVERCIARDDACHLISKCHGFTGSDIAAMCRNALANAVFRCEIESNTALHCTVQDFEAARQSVRPTALARELAVQVAAVSWDDIGGLQQVKVSHRDRSLSVAVW
jgi:SpoVK/Ycf46/Vps4 family AAA+-type ATPase